MISQLAAFGADRWLALLLTAVGAYLLGSLNFAIIVTRLMSHADIRDSGSGNAGATNVLRSQGKLAAALTTVGDLAKSIAAVLLGGCLMTAMAPAGAAGGPLDTALVGRYLAGMCCMVGHIYPLFFGFRGGKGVLTALGTMLVLDWRAALICLALFIAVTAAWRMVSLGSVTAACALPLVTGLFSAYVDRNTSAETLFCVIMTVVIAAILVVKHIPNLKRIRQGTESKLGRSKPKP